MIDFDSMQTRIDHLFLLLNSKGNEAYHSEPVSQLEHALQSAYYAKYHTDKPNIILAALLHDIGHLIEDETEDLLGHYDHDRIGAAYPRDLGFGPDITRLVENHVRAKRYLVTTDFDYKNKLSAASKLTLIQQGGPMRVDEVESFESDPDFDDIILIRICDELAKTPGLPVPLLESYSPMIKQYLMDVNKIEN